MQRSAAGPGDLELFPPCPARQDTPAQVSTYLVDGKATMRGFQTDYEREDAALSLDGLSWCTGRAASWAGAVSPLALVRG